MDEFRTVTCTVCPMGCSIRVRLENGQPVAYEGHQCKRGPVYARDEVLDPRRMLTTTVRVCGSATRLVPARTSAVVPRDRLMEVMALVRGLCVAAPVEAGQVLCDDLLGTGVDLVATGSVPAEPPAHAPAPTPDDPPERKEDTR